MTWSEEEHCVTCLCPTGKAGKGEDSLFLEDPYENGNDIGPFCDGCYDKNKKILEGTYIYQFREVAKQLKDLFGIVVEPYTVKLEHLETLARYFRDWRSTD